MSEFIATDFGKNMDFDKFQKSNKKDDSTFITIEYKEEIKKGKLTKSEKLTKIKKENSDIKELKDKKQKS